MSVNVQEILAKLAAGEKAGEVIFPATAGMAVKVQRRVDDRDGAFDPATLRNILLEPAAELASLIGALRA